jgi:ADP-dependent NAD(P)H-hydrate dehydratase / NAD(P)H-hydrate epimerase
LKKQFKPDIIVDAIFGTGFHGRPDSVYEKIIEHINSCSARVLAIDIPSGLNATTGIVESAAVRADMTVAMGFAKAGFYKNDGPAFCGKIKVVDIGLIKQQKRI